MAPPSADGICSLCNSELYGKVIKIAGKNYHNRCFCCCQCRKPLSSEAFRMRKVGLRAFEIYTPEQFVLYKLLQCRV